MSTALKSILSRGKSADGTRQAAMRCDAARGELGGKDWHSRKNNRFQTPDLAPRCASEALQANDCLKRDIQQNDLTTF